MPTAISTAMTATEPRTSKISTLGIIGYRQARMSAQLIRLASALGVDQRLHQDVGSLAHS
jgi:hypothetical protein